ILKWFFVFLAWALFIFLAIKASQVERDHIDYDPYEILQVDRGATQQEIKRQYRTLSRVMHPDKGGDPEEFVKLTKAHAALTNEESRKNWEEYGNPDGPQAINFGIALPSWIVDQENSVWVLAAYGLAFMVILPIVVGTWWYRSIKYSAVEVLLDTSQLFLHFIYKTPCMNLKRALMILSGAFEFEKSHNSEVQNRPSDNEELPPLVREFSGDIGMKNKQRPFCYPYSIKARTLLYAHLARVPLPRETLEQDSLYIVKKCPQLIQEMVNTASQLVAWQKFNRVQKEPRLESIENLMKLSPMVIQAAWEKTPLLQLAHFNEETLRMCTSKRRNVKTLGHFMRMKDTDRRHILRHLQETQYQNVLNVCAQLPQLDAEVTLEVLDDEDKATITAGAVVTATVMLYRNSYTISVDSSMLDPDNVPAIEDLNNDVKEIKEEDKTDSPVANKNKHKAWEKQKKKSKGKKAKNKKQMEQAKKKANKAKSQQESAEQNHVEDGAVQEVKEAKEDGSGESGGSESDDEQEETTQEVQAKNSGSDDESANSDSNVDNEEDEWERLQSGITRKEKVLEGKSKDSHEVHCPYFPDVKQEWWWVYLADRKSHRLVTLPQMVYDLKEEKEIQLQFTAPPKGNYQFQLCVRSDSYLDMDLIKPVKFDVKEAKKMVDVDKQWDLSEDEEDKGEAEDSDVDYTTDDEGSDEE
ncbi:translocation protein SEC63 homolog, partial [Amphiura filiformis]|uniref:translocation protein SEC63 homolog n=1 Tax=Amphiura filiformis TaxID=82378 RepID=UPI003B2285B6